MLGIDQMAQSIRKKISLKDHKPSSPFEENTSIQQEVNASKGKKETTAKGSEEKTSKSLDVETSKHQNGETREGLEVNTSTHQDDKKQSKVFKTTVYFSEDTKKKFDEIYAKRILAEFKTDKTDLLCEAINLLYEKEKERVEGSS